MLEPEVEARPWDEQLALDEAAYRIQLEYLLDRSVFYQRLAAAEIDTASDAGGLAELGQLPLTEKQELRETVSPDDPIGTHLCAPPGEIVRIYSTSGTTGTPSYIPLTAGDLANWIAGSARSYAASGVTAGQRIVSTYNAGPFMPGAALASFDRIGLCHIPVGTGNSERLTRAVEVLRPEAAVLTPSYAAHLIRWAAERGISLAASSVERVIVTGRAGGRRASLPRDARGGLGRNRDRGDGDQGHRRVALGGVRGARTGGMHLGAGLRPRRLLDAETGDARALGDGGSGELVLTHLRHRAAPLLRFRTATTSRCVPARAPAGGRAPGSAASGERTTC